MAKHCDFCFRVAIFLASVAYLVDGGCDDTAVGLGGGTVPDNKLTASSDFDNTTPARNGRLNYIASSSWCASSGDPILYFQVDLESVHIICAVATQGNSRADQWVKTYEVQYSTDGSNWLDYQENGNIKTFQANYDRNTVVKSFLFEGVQTQYIRVIPKLYYNSVCLRLELYGITKAACLGSAVGVDESDTIPNYRFIASSYFDGRYKPYKARIRASPGWTTKRNAKINSWLKIDLGNAFAICAIETLGSATHTERVTKYKLRLSMDNVTWQYYQENGIDKIFLGNTVNPSNKVTNDLNQATPAKFIEVWPTDFFGFPTLRMEMYGVTQACRSSLGVEKGAIADSKLTGSSGVASRGRLYNAAAAWCANTLSNNEYIQVELNELATVTGVAVQGHPTLMQWTKTFRIRYSYNSKDWIDFKDAASSVKIFTAADGHRKGITNWFRYPFVARYVRIYPQTWEQRPCVRFDLYGCNSVKTPEVLVTGTVSVSSDNKNANIALECRARGQPTPSVEWKNGAIDVTSQAKLVAQADGSSLSRLTWSIRLSQFPLPNTVCVGRGGSIDSRARSCPLQDYTCVASYLPSDGGGMNVSQTSLTIGLNVPAAATNLRLSKVAARSVTISWDTPDPGHTPITSYKIQINNGPTFIFNRILNSREIFLLTPYRDYAFTFKVTAVSKLGEGLTAQEAISFRTKQSAPSAPQGERFTGYEFIPRVTVRWDPPSTPNGVIQLYTLYYRYLPDGNVTKVTINDPKARNKTVDVVGGFTYIFEISATTVEEGPKSRITDTVPEYAPQAAPSDFKFSHVDAFTLNCSWTPPPREKSHGTIRSYNVSYQRKLAGRRKRAVTTINTKTPYALLTGLQTVCYIYEVSVRAITVRPGPYSAMVPIANAFSAATPPNNLKVTDIRKRRVTIEWENLSMVGSIQGYKVQLKGRKAYDKSFQDDRVIDVVGNQTTVHGLFPATDYEFQVAIKTECPELTYSGIVRDTTAIDNPPRPNITAIQNEKLPGTAATITLSPSSSQNGPISLYQVIVLITDKDNQMLPKDFEKRLKNFAEAKKANIKFYIALEIPAENVTANSKFIVGDEKTYGQYFNAKLGKGGTYIIFVRAISKLNGEVFPGQYSKVAEISVTKEKDPSQTGADKSLAIIAGVVSTFIVIALVIVIVFIINRRRNRSTEAKAKKTKPMTLRALALQSDGNGGSVANLVSEEQVGEDRRSPVAAKASYPKLPLKESSARHENSHFEKAAALTVPAAEGEDELYSEALEESHHKPIPVVQFSEYMNRVKGGNYARLRQEYNEFPKAKQFPWTFAEKPENKELNRFANIMAYDHSRVNVKLASAVKYINANYIDGWDGTPKAYIATQGPLPKTLPIFWLMVWNERVGSIVMVTNIVEKGKTKCHQYWPENTAEYGSIKVSLHKVEAFADFTIRTFILNKDSQTRTILQFHFTVWPDHGVPRLPTNIISLRRRVRAQTPKETGPVLVHCSAGVGRTGTYIVVDAMLERAKKQKNVDIYNYMHVVRKGRIHMVQTEDQYIFLHKAVLEALTCGNTEINPNNIRSSLKNLALPSGTQGKTGYALEFERLSFVCPNPGQEECETASKQVNIKKNRFPELTPLDISRVLLLRPVLKDGDDYINASFADAYKERNTFILTQSPMHNTIQDFWQMVFDYSIGSVVMLNNIKEGGSIYPKYWPEAETKGQMYGDMKVELLSQENFGQIVFRKLTVEDKKLNRHPQTVHHLQHTAWPNHSVPKNKQSVLDLVTRVTSALQQSRNTSFVVQCSDGVGRSGTFCSIYSTLERIKLEQIVDVFQTCKVVRARRPSAVETVEQYQFCYEMVQEFLDSFSDYSNFDDI